MPRKPIGDRPMTAAERKHHSRERQKEAVERLSAEQKFRRELFAFVDGYLLLHRSLTRKEAENALDAMAFLLRQIDQARKYCELDDRAYRCLVHPPLYPLLMPLFTV